jgi:hypothetical protein
MKNLKFLQILLLFTLSACDGCEEELTTLPPETQTGANTFGCYVNGELFVNDGTAPWMNKPVDAEYHRISTGIVLHSYSPTGYIYLVVEKSQPNVPMPISLAYYIPNGQRDCDYYGGENIGEIMVTKLDTVNRIISGRFQFPCYCLDRFLIANSNDTIINITEGRFDIKMSIFN